MSERLILCSLAKPLTAGVARTLSVLTGTSTGVWAAGVLSTGFTEPESETDIQHHQT